MLAACGTLAAACGSAAAPAAKGTGSPQTTSPGQVNLSITLSGSSARHWTLRCEPPSGNVPDPQAACQRLLGHRRIFMPSPHHVMCPQIMGDGPSYLVSGTFLGVRVHDEIVDGGCDLAKWSILHAIFQ